MKNMFVNYKFKLFFRDYSNECIDSLEECDIVITSEQMPLNQRVSNCFKYVFHKIKSFMDSIRTKFSLLLGGRD